MRTLRWLGRTTPKRGEADTLGESDQPRIDAAEVLVGIALARSAGGPRNSARRPQFGAASSSGSAPCVARWARRERARSSGHHEKPQGGQPSPRGRRPRARRATTQSRHPPACRRGSAREGACADARGIAVSGPPDRDAGRVADLQPAHACPSARPSGVAPAVRRPLSARRRVDAAVRRLDSDALPNWLLRAVRVMGTK